MKTVYILTKEGRAYTKEGCDHVTDMIRRLVKDDDELVFAMGAMYNEPKYLITALEKHPDAYIVVSTSERIEILYGENVEITVERVKENPEENTWVTVTKGIEEMKEKLNK